MKQGPAKGEADALLVERRSSLGLGYCRRQLCYLQKPHYGSMYAILPLSTYSEYLTAAQV